jgi:hypothetical protein
LCSSRLVSSVFNVVIVVIELYLQVVGLDGSFSSLKSDSDITGTDSVVPDVRSPSGVVSQVTSAAVAQSLVDDIPSVAAVSEVLDEVGDVVLKHCGQVFFSPSARGKPVGKLVVPVQVVASHKSSRRCSVSKEDLRLGVVENTLLGFSKYPPIKRSVLYFTVSDRVFLLHGVGRSDLSPIISVGEFSTVVLVCGLVGARDICSCSKVKLSSLLCVVIQALLSSGCCQQGSGLSCVGGRASSGGDDSRRSCRAVC